MAFAVEPQHLLEPEDRKEKPEPLQVELKYDRTELSVTESVKATAKVTNASV